MSLKNEWGNHSNHKEPRPILAGERLYDGLHHCSSEDQLGWWVIAERAGVGGAFVARSYAALHRGRWRSAGEGGRVGVKVDY